MNIATQYNNVIVMGLGLTGVSCVRYCVRKNWPVTVLDSRENPAGLAEFKASFPDVTVICGDFSEAILLQADLIIVSPGVDRRHVAISKALNSGIEIVGDVELFVRENCQPIIAITGSNGKSTVCDAMEHFLKASGKTVIAAGNIGKPVLNLLNEEQPDVYVLELSSFQLESIDSLNADVAVVLNISPDHLDRYDTYEDYANAKRKLYQMTRVAVINLDDEASHKTRLPENVISFGNASSSDYRVTKSSQGFVVQYDERVLLNEQECLIKGLHNGVNLAACCALLDAFDIEIDDPLIKAMKTYAGLAFRCQWIPTEDDIRWINDSKGTNVGATLSAIESFASSHSELYLIAGGDAKGGEIEQLKTAFDQHVTYCWAFGKDSDRFIQSFSDLKCEKVEDLEIAVGKAKQRAKKGDCVLFSPACASLDMYDNYIARGNHFNQLIQGAV